ncbi:hypothetical protein E3U55_14590 [Filobacillus milosensis]|uniref:Tissue inhibitor of metalloproteinase n=1 Tax=Filobacillus milosensis TaxID=94137 RepID=A0A4Y8IDS4_9BACI|nr:hypothetical protein [Filobacillus milosensis]TFB14138.1 hypothetical protein E3U55_14590 [Filobacillus milosensis]
MNTFRGLISTVIILMFVSIYLPNTSYACTCEEPGTVQEEMNQSSAVFSGKVIEKYDENKDKKTISSNDPIAFVFEVKESWKGINQTQVVVSTARYSGSCGYEFALNNNYLVYAQERNGELEVNLCSRTTVLPYADQDLEELGKGKKPTEQVTINLKGETPSEPETTKLKGTSKTDNHQVTIYIISALLVLGLVYLTLIRLKK